MPQTAETVITAVFLVLVTALLVAAVIAWGRSGSPVFLLLLIGGTIACPNEPVANLFGGVWHSGRGAWLAFTTYGRPIPVWVVPAYTLFFGALPCLVLLLLRRGATRRALWIGAIAIFVVETPWEVGFHNLGVYQYYGYQPYSLFGFPLFWFFPNALAVLLIAVAVAVFPGAFAGRRRLLLLGLPAVAQISAYTIGLPSWALFNAGAHPALLWAAATFTIVVGAWALDALAGFASARLASPGSLIRTPEARSPGPAVAATGLAKPV